MTPNKSRGRAFQILEGLELCEHILVEHNNRTFYKLHFVRVFYHLGNRATAEKQTGGKVQPLLNIFAKENY